MEIVVTGRHIDVPERFRRAADEKLSKISQLAPKAQRVDVEYIHERNPRQAQKSHRVEITVKGKGPVVRAEACAEDLIAALDLAFGKVLERLRRSHDRRKNHHAKSGGLSKAVFVDQAGDEAFAEALAEANSLIVHDEEAAGQPDLGASPVVIRVKDHPAEPMSIDQAVYEMELVGHPFFLFVDAESGRPSVVYHRVGWTYGVLRLDTSADAVARDEVRQPVTAGI